MCIWESVAKNLACIIWSKIIVNPKTPDSYYLIALPIFDVIRSFQSQCASSIGRSQQDSNFHWGYFRCTLVYISIKSFIILGLGRPWILWLETFLILTTFNSKMCGISISYYYITDPLQRIISTIAYRY